MLESYLQKYTQPYAPDVTYRELDQRGEFLLTLAKDEFIYLREMGEKIILRALLGPVPKDHRETLFCHLMSANFMGMGTGGGEIAIVGEQLTLSKELEEGIPFHGFTEALEDFWNYSENYWKGELTHLQELANSKLL